jgi:hypothetical protein
MAIAPRKLRLAVSAAVAIAGCQPGSGASTASEGSPVYRALREILAGPAVGACGADVPARPASLILVTARHCLSCKDVGRLLRGVLQASPDSMALQLVVPAPDTGPVCAFLREERIRLPVRVLSSSSSAEIDGSPPIGYARLDSSGAIVDSALSRDGLALLSDLRSRGWLSSPAPTTTERGGTP